MHGIHERAPFHVIILNVSDSIQVWVWNPIKIPDHTFLHLLVSSCSSRGSSKAISMSNHGGPRRGAGPKRKYELPQPVNDRS